jgi:hypothetical protein
MLTEGGNLICQIFNKSSLFTTSLLYFCAKFGSKNGMILENKDKTLNYT